MKSPTTYLWYGFPKIYQNNESNLRVIFITWYHSKKFPQILLLHYFRYIFSIFWKCSTELEQLRAATLAVIPHWPGNAIQQYSATVEDILRHVILLIIIIHKSIIW